MIYNQEAEAYSIVRNKEKKSNDFSIHTFPKIKVVAHFLGTHVFKTS